MALLALLGAAGYFVLEGVPEGAIDSVLYAVLVAMMTLGAIYFRANAEPRTTSPKYRSWTLQRDILFFGSLITGTMFFTLGRPDKPLDYALSGLYLIFFGLFLVLFISDRPWSSGPGARGDEGSSQVINPDSERMSGVPATAVPHLPSVKRRRSETWALLAMALLVLGAKQISDRRGR